MNIKKMFTTLAAMVVAVTMVMPSASVLGATYSAELQEAYNWAYSKGVTTQSPIDNANMYGAITRAEMAKMLSVYATEVLGMTPDTSAACTFTDIASVKGDLHDYIIESCQLGIMGQGITAFRPYDTLSRAEFGTALSRVLWASTYEGGTPYYAKHLDALKSAGIMTQIANAESTKEVRGYVMLMLMRAEGNEAVVDCDDPMTVIACTTNTDACPAACRENNNTPADEDIVVKAGDLAVTATAAAGRRVLIGNVSDLDTLTFRTSEEVTLSKVILERYGYSQNDDVESVWLEDENGNVISSESNGLDSKGQAKLTIKKDYKKVDGTYNATIVVKARGTAGNTMWFKVVSVDSTAANLNIDNYRPYTYDMVAYSGVEVTFVVRGTTKDYNYEAGESYEVSKFKVKAPADSAILVGGFTLTNIATDKVDVERYIDDLTVTADGKDVKARYSIDRSDRNKVVVSFDDVEVAAKKNVEFTVSMSFNEDFEDYGKSVRYAIAEEKDFSAVDAKTESRVQPDLRGITWPLYNFLGGKIKLSNVKVGNVEAAYGSVDVKVAEGSISTTEALKGTFAIYASNSAGLFNRKILSAIDEVRVSIAGDEYDATRFYSFESFGNATCTASLATWEAKLIGDATIKVTENSVDPNTWVGKEFDITAWTTAGCYVATAWNDTVYVKVKEGFRFKNVDIEKSGKVVVKVDLTEQPEFEGAKIEFSTINADAFSELTYEDVRSNNNALSQVAGFVTVYNLTVKPGKAAFKNNLTKAVEFVKSETNNKVVFDGTYTAKNGTVNLTDWTVAWTDPSTKWAKVTFYLSVDGDEVADVKMTWSSVTSPLSNLRIDEWEEVKVVVTAEVEGTTTGDLGTYAIAFEGEDLNGNKAGNARANTVALKIVEKGSVTVSSEAAKATVLRKAAGSEIAQFTVKPSNGASDVDFDSISFTLTGSTAFADFDEYDVTLSIGDSDETITVTTWADYITVSGNPFVTLPSNGVVVKVRAEKELTGTIVLTGLTLNGTSNSKTFSKRFEAAVVRIVAQQDIGGATKFTLEVDADSDVTVSNFKYRLGTGASLLTWVAGDFSDGETFEVPGIADVAQYVTAIQYSINGNPITVIEKDDYSDFFKIGDTYVRVFKA